MKQLPSYADISNKNLLKIQANSENRFATLQFKHECTSHGIRYTPNKIARNSDPNEKTKRSHLQGKFQHIDTYLSQSTAVIPTV